MLRSPALRESLVSVEVDLWMSTLAKVVEQAQSKGEIDPDLDATAAARDLFAMWQDFVVQKALTPEADVDGFLEVVRALYGGSFWTGPRQTPDKVKREAATAASPPAGSET